MPSNGRTSNLAPLVAAIVLLGWLAVAAAACDVGFLADDYDVGALLHRRAETSPNPWGRAFSIFGEKIGERFEVYRPLTILSIELDYALHGPNGRAHHATNVALWILAALASGFVAAAFARRGGGLDEGQKNRAARRAGSAAFVFSLTSFAAIESLGWLVAREDLIVAAAGTAALAAQLRRPFSPLATVPWLVLAFLGKETAVVLPPCLVVARLIDAATGGDRRAALASANDALPATRRVVFGLVAPWLVLAAYFGARFAIYGGVGSTYLDRPYAEWLADGAAPGHLATSMGRLFAPWNDALSHRFGIPLAVRWIVPVFTGILLYGGFRFRARQNGDLAGVVSLLPLLAASPALTSPMYAVAPSLQQGRTLALPAVIFAAILGVAFARARAVGGGFRRGALIAGGILVAWSGAAQWFHLSPFISATRHAESFLDDVAATPPGARAVALGLEDATSAANAPYRAELILSDGAYVLSGAVPAALGPPFRNPAIPFSVEPAVVFDPASGSLLVSDPRRTAFFTARPSRDLPCGPGEPRLTPWSLPSDAPEAELADLDVAAGTVHVRPFKSPVAGIVALYGATDLGRSARFDLGAPPNAAAEPKVVALDPALAAELLTGSPRFLLWRVAFESDDGRVVAVQLPKAASLTPR